MNPNNLDFIWYIPVAFTRKKYLTNIVSNAFYKGFLRLTLPKKHTWKNEHTCDISFIGDHLMRKINTQYAHKPKTTDVLSFPSSKPEWPYYRGTIVFDWPLIFRRIQIYHVNVPTHLSLLTIHSVLHLCGFTHDTTENCVQMQALEIQGMQYLGYPNPYV